MNSGSENLAKEEILPSTRLHQARPSTGAVRSTALSRIDMFSWRKSPQRGDFRMNRTSSGSSDLQCSSNAASHPSHPVLAKNPIHTKIDLDWTGTIGPIDRRSLVPPCLRLGQVGFARAGESSVRHKTDEPRRLEPRFFVHPHESRSRDFSQIAHHRRGVMAKHSMTSQSPLSKAFSRSCCISRIGGTPKTLLYSRLK